MTHHHVALDEWEAVAPVLCAITYDEADPAQWMNVCVSAGRRHWAALGSNTTVELLGGPATDTDTIHLNPRSVAAGLDLARCHGHTTVVGNDHDVTITSGPVTLTISARGLENDPGLIPLTSGPTTVARLCAGDLATTVLTAWVHPRGTDPSRPTPQSVLAIRDQTVEIRTDWDDHLLGVTTVAADATTTGAWLRRPTSSSTTCSSPLHPRSRGPRHRGHSRERSRLSEARNPELHRPQPTHRHLPPSGGPPKPSRPSDRARLPHHCSPLAAGPSTTPTPTSASCSSTAHPRSCGSTKSSLATSNQPSAFR